MKKSHTLQWLLALTFVVGQWLGVVHGTQHELNAADKLVACEVCAVGHASAGPPAAPVVVASFVPAAEVPAALPVAAFKQQLLLRPPTRGPPSNLA